MGVLSDVGAAALLKSPLISQLQKLDIHHHYCSDEMVAQLKQLPIEVDASGQQREERWGRSIAVSE